jgi:hypothetical protein
LSSKIAPSQKIYSQLPVYENIYDSSSKTEIFVIMKNRKKSQFFEI